MQWPTKHLCSPSATSRMKQCMSACYDLPASAVTGVLAGLPPQSIPPWTCPFVWLDYESDTTPGLDSTSYCYCLFMVHFFAAYTKPKHHAHQRLYSVQTWISPAVSNPTSFSDRQGRENANRTCLPLLAFPYLTPINWVGNANDHKPRALWPGLQSKGHTVRE